MQPEKKRIFIGSSSEEVKLAELAKTVLDKHFEVTIWNDNIWDTSIFKINQNFLSDLLKATLQYDFGILLGTTDDKVVYREKEMLQPRDNVLFELGLFTGRLGISKCAFIVEKELKVLSDLSGISLARFEKGDLKGFITAVEQVKDLFLASHDSEINFFPSATLASVYFENLVAPICKHVIENDGFDLKGTRHRKCILNIVVPEKISQDVNIQFQKMKSGIEMENVSFNYAGRPRQISIETKVKNDTLEFIDFPTIIAGINHAIQNLLPTEFNAMSADYEAILDRELKRFITTLKGLLLRHGFDEMVCIKRSMDSIQQ